MPMFQRPRARSPRAIDKPYRFLRLPLRVDVAPLVAELDALGGARRLPWMQSQWKWHLETRFCILRAGREGRHYEGSALVGGADVDQPVLDRLPETRRFLDEAFPVPARLAWLGESPPGARIFLHVDNTEHWDEHHRVHVPLITNPAARLAVGRRFVHMAPGEVWAFNNSAAHGAMNRAPSGTPARIHLMLDLPSTPEVEALLARAERVEGEADREAWEELGTNPLKSLHRGHYADQELITRLLQQ